MAYEPKNGELTLWLNDKKSKETDPDFTVSGRDLSGRDVTGGAWKNKTKAGAKILKVKLRHKEPKPQSDGWNESNPPPRDDFDSW